MAKEDIVFFDKLGYGWTVDANVVRQITSENLRNEAMSERSLFEHVYERKDRVR